MELPTTGESNNIVNWVDATGDDHAAKFGLRGFHALTTVGRNLWLKAHPSLFENAVQELADFVAQHSLSFSCDNPQTLKFQLVHLAIAVPGLALTRDDLQAWVDRVELNSRDVIQALNKTEQWGLSNVRIKKGTIVYYYIPRPFRLEVSHIDKRRCVTDPLSHEEKVRFVAGVKDMLRQSIINIPVEKWDVGHRDPRTKKELVYQANKYQRARRDRFKFDELGLVLCPTVEELSSNLSKYFPTEEELKTLAEAVEKARRKKGK